MEEYIENYEESDSGSGWWEEETTEAYGEDTGDDTSWDAVTEDGAASGDVEIIEKLDSLLETFSLSQSYGTVGDYYNQILGFTVFPDFDTYQYFIDIDADGHLWAAASDGHYVPLSCLEVYESYISGEDAEEEAQPTEHEVQTLETMENVVGMLSVIKENNTAYYEASLACQQDITARLDEINARLEITGYLLMATAFFVALCAGSRFANVFFGRMKAG